MPTIARIGVALVAVAFVASSASAQQVDLPRPSPNAKLSQFIGVTEVTVEYSCPGVKNRKIWGGVVPYDKVWRAGANSPTKVTFAKDVVIDGKPLAAGSYTFLVIPTAGKWTLIFNRDPKGAGVFGYNKADDVLRVDVKPQPAPMRERLAYSFANFGDAGGNLELEWEKLRVTLPIKVHTDDQVAASIKGLENGGWSPWANAARYQLEHKNIDDGMVLVEKSIGRSRRPGSTTSSRRSSWPRAGITKRRCRWPRRPRSSATRTRTSSSRTTSRRRSRRGSPRAWASAAEDSFVVPLVARDHRRAREAVDGAGAGRLGEARV